MSQHDVVERWLTLSHQVLVDEVHQLVRRHDDQAHRCWIVVRNHPVLAARVRGILSALERHSAEYRDAALWRIWINQARNSLTPSPPTHPAARDTSTADEDRPAAPASGSNHHAAPHRQMIFREPGQ